MRSPSPSADTFNLRDIQATPFPNRLLEVVATLPETEARIVCVVVRATLGWHAGWPGERRASVLMAHAELRRAISRSSKTTVSNSIDSLVRRGLLETMTADGVILATPEERRRHHRPMRYRLARAYVVAAGSSSVDNRVDNQS